MQIGNGWIDDNMCAKGMYDYFWTHALNSDETHEGIERHCDFESGNLTSECNKYQRRGDDEIGVIDIYDIYGPPCDFAATKAAQTPRSVSSISSTLILFIYYKFVFLLHKIDIYLDKSYKFDFLLIKVKFFSLIFFI